MATIRINAQDKVPAVATLWGRARPKFRWACVTDSTNSFNFPKTTGALQLAFAGGADDAFVEKIVDGVLPPPNLPPNWAR